MRLLLLPISTRHTLLYCKPQPTSLLKPAGQASLIDKGTQRAATLWASWEKKEGGWQKKVVEYGNKALKRIPYEEWGLRSVPPLSARRRADELVGKDKVEVVYPPSLIAAAAIPDVLQQLGTERYSLHRRRMIWCFVGMPITAPIAILPVIPNIPFFYLVYRAWCHWRAQAGSKHVQFLVENQLLTPTPCKDLDRIYTGGADAKAEDSASEHTSSTAADYIVLKAGSEAGIAQVTELPELEHELERARWQVEHHLQAEQTKTKNE